MYCLLTIAVMGDTLRRNITGVENTFGELGVREVNTVETFKPLNDFASSVGLCTGFDNDISSFFRLSLNLTLPRTFVGTIRASKTFEESNAGFDVDTTTPAEGISLCCDEETTDKFCS